MQGGELLLTRHFGPFVVSKLVSPKTHPDILMLVGILMDQGTLSACTILLLSGGSNRMRGQDVTLLVLCRAPRLRLCVG